MNIERLEKLATVLDHFDPSVTFDIRVWQVPTYKSQGMLWWKKEVPCGYAACAVGYACGIPEFNQMGLVLKTGKNDTLVPTYKVDDNLYMGGVAVEKFFDISEKDVENLFTTSGYIDEIWNDELTPGVVAAKIRAFVKQHKPKEDSAVNKQVTEMINSALKGELIQLGD